MTTKKIPQSVKAILFIFSVMILCGLAFFGSYAIYCGVAQKEFVDGKTAFEAKDWQTASKHFESVAGLYKLSLPSHRDEVKTLIDECNLLISANDSRTSGDFAASIETYNNYSKLYPESAKKFKIATIVSSVYLDWVNALQQSGQYELAVEKSSELIDSYPDSAAAATIVETLPTIYLDWAEALHNDSDYEGAVAKYRTVLTSYGKTSSVDQASSAIAETYRDWGDSLAGEENYDLAVEKYNILMNEFSGQASAQNAENSLAEIYINWASQLRANDQPDQAFQKYKDVLNKLSNTPSVSEANAALAPTMLEWAVVAQKNQNYSKQVELLHEIISDYDGTPEADKAAQMIFTAYDFLGQQLMSKGSFLLAIQTYTDAQEFVHDEASKASADAGYNAAIEGLARDTGADGEKVISDANTTACQGEKNVSPAIGIHTDEPAKARLCSSLLIPPDWMASTPGSFRYVIEVNRDTVKIQSCPYRGDDGSSLTLERYRQVATVTLRNTKTGAIAKDTKINGSAPIGCPGRYTFYSSVATETGGPVDDQDIIDWLANYFK